MGGCGTDGQPVSRRGPRAYSRLLISSARMLARVRWRAWRGLRLLMRVVVLLLTGDHALRVIICLLGRIRIALGMMICLLRCGRLCRHGYCTRKGSWRHPRQDAAPRAADTQAVFS